MNLDKFLQWAKTLTWPKLIITTVAGLCFVAIFTLWENRQKVFETQTARFSDDFLIKTPSSSGDFIVKDFMRLHPEVAMISLLDANPISNTREVRARWFNSSQIKSIVETSIKDNPNMGNGPLFTASEENNKQILAVLNGEFYCAPVAQGIMQTQFPEAAKLMKYSCRVPLPPAFGKATGWFAIHTQVWPIPEYDLFKNAALMMSLTYYSQEIVKSRP